VAESERTMPATVAPPAPIEERPRGAALEDRYAIERGRVLLSGTQALVRLPMAQRQRDVAAGLNTAGYVSGYRG
jgi:indolepyruvate ferredoxin oxidoreductase